MSATRATDVTGDPQMPVVDVGTVDGVLAESGRITVLFFRGDPERWPETADVAVILPELIAAFGGALVPAVVASDAEKLLMKRFGVTVFPSLVLARPDRILGVIAKLQDWSNYLARINAMLIADALPTAELPS
ncbi:hydrogenase-1 operon protein HyaE [Rhodopseudomonas faecalis]|uniref:Hydrogenase expression/formation protein n=1 Tax=Rhodopseudomonas faecalis TaxID=99655 RepID=A0A318TCF0_9BRAD|nr:hydrogenase accessory protein [Rhodopseudomonas faecalis]PYF02692.1 hydrogenase-1 operon protein HyaE [Rhodopseudomonas faecalis]TAH68211.1 MAG: hydrogenase accessory protein [Rhodopseudomonas palustris]